VSRHGPAAAHSASARAASRNQAILNGSAVVDCTQLSPASPAVVGSCAAAASGARCCVKFSNVDAHTWAPGNCQRAIEKALSTSSTDSGGPALSTRKTQHMAWRRPGTTTHEGAPRPPGCRGSGPGGHG